MIEPLLQVGDCARKGRWSSLRAMLVFASSRLVACRRHGRHSNGNQAAQPARIQERNGARRLRRFNGIKPSVFRFFNISKYVDREAARMPRSFDCLKSDVAQQAQQLSLAVKRHPYYSRRAYVISEVAEVRGIRH